MKKSVLLLGLALSFHFSFSQAPEIEWQKAYGGDGKDIAYKLISTSDGGLILGGHSNSNSGDVSGNHGAIDIWVIKFNPSGEIQWKKTYGGSGDEMLASISEIADQGYIFTGYSTSANGDLTNNNGETDLWVVKLDSEGNIEWQKSLGGENHDAGNSVYQTSDGGFIIGGITGGNHVNIPYSGWIIKLDSAGNTQWENIYEANSHERIIATVKQNIDGEYFFAGNDFIDHITGTNGWIGKLSESGELLWEKLYGGMDSDYLNSFQFPNDGGMVIGGWTFSSDGDIPENKGEIDFWILKVDENGNKEWSKTYGGSADDKANDIIHIANGGYLIAGETSSNDGDVSEINGETAAWLVKLDSNGNLVWQKTYGTGIWQGSTAVIERNPNQYSFGGFTYSADVPNYHGDSDFWLVSLFPEILSTNEVESNRITVYPNPVKTILKFTETMKEVQIFDLNGRLLSTFKNSSEIDLSEYSKGTYILKGISASGNNFTQKLIKN